MCIMKDTGVNTYKIKKSFSCLFQSLDIFYSRNKLRYQNMNHFFQCEKKHIHTILTKLVLAKGNYGTGFAK